MTHLKLQKLQIGDYPPAHRLNVNVLFINITKRPWGHPLMRRGMQEGSAKIVILDRYRVLAMLQLPSVIHTAAPDHG